MLLLHALEHVSATLPLQEGEFKHTKRPNVDALLAHAHAIHECFSKSGAILAVKRENFWDDRLASQEVRAIYRWLFSLLCEEKCRKNNVFLFLRESADRIAKRFGGPGRPLSQTTDAESQACEKVIARTTEMVRQVTKEANVHIVTAKKLLRRALRGRARIFIGSSTQSLGIASCLKRGLDEYYDCTLWNEMDVFVAAQVAIETLESAIMQYDLAIFVCANDDECRVCGAGKAVAIPRDNVLFELGLFMGRHSHKRVFILREKTTKLPTDLNGVGYVNFERAPSKKRPIKQLNQVCDRVRAAIRKVEDELAG